MGLDVLIDNMETGMKELEQVPWGWAGKQWLPQQFINYRVTQPVFERMWAEQNGRCAGCQRELAHPLKKELGRFGLKPETDHLHVEGRHCEVQDVRGLLCRHCNQFLSKIRDNMDVLEGLLAHLHKHGDLK